MPEIATSASKSNEPSIDGKYIPLCSLILKHNTNPLPSSVRPILCDTENSAAICNCVVV